MIILADEPIIIVVYYADAHESIMSFPGRCFVILVTASRSDQSPLFRSLLASFGSLALAGDCACQDV